jgi:hypothetical protein
MHRWFQRFATNLKPIKVGDDRTTFEPAIFFNLLTGIVGLEWVFRAPKGHSLAFDVLRAEHASRHHASSDLWLETVNEDGKRISQQRLTRLLPGLDARHTPPPIMAGTAVEALVALEVYVQDLMNGAATK